MTLWVAVITAMVGLTVIVPGASAAPIGWETLSFGDTPTEGALTATSIGTGIFYVTTAQAHSGTKSVTTSGAITGVWTGLNLCNQGSFTVWLRVANLGAASQFFQFSAQPGGAQNVNSMAIIITQTSGAVFFRVASSTAEVNQNTGVVMPTLTWVDFTIKEVDCANAKAKLTSATLGLVINVDAAGSVAGSDLDTINTQSNNGQMWLDDFDAGTTTTQFTTAANTASVTDLVAFDVDDTGTTAIARTNLGDFVRTYSAQFLGTEAASADTDCAGFGRVIAEGDNVGYIDCGGTSDILRIKSATLNTPTAPADCDATDVDRFDSDVADNIFTITDFAVLTIDYEFSDDGTCTAIAKVIASTYTGQVGVVTKQLFGGASQHDSDFVQYGPTSLAVDQICGSTMIIPGDSDPTTRDILLFAADETLVTKAWESSQLTSHLTPYRTYSAAFGQANSIACSSSNTTYAKVLLGLGSGVRAINPVAETQLWQRTDILPSANGVALSRNGLWAAASAGGTTYVLNATTGATVATITNPSGSFRDVEIDSTGQSVWVATSTTIARFEVYTATTSVPVGTTYGQDPTFGCPGGDCGNEAAGLIPEGGLFGAISGTLFMGFLLVFGVIWMGIRQGAPGMAIGALFFVGLGLAYAIGWMPIWMIVVLTLLSVGASFLIPKADNASGGLA